MTDYDSKVRVLLGPPGTGKTTTLMNELESLLASGVSPGEIAFVSFTKGAIKVAVDRACERFGFVVDDLPFFRTIHSMAFHAMGKRKVMEDKDWKSFGESFTYSFSDQGDEPTLNFSEDGDCLKSLHELRRVKKCSIEEAILHAGDVPPHVTSDMVTIFASRLAEWKREHDVIDFTDMLECALVADWRPPVRFAFIDESQDNSRLQNALTKHWFWNNSRCVRVTYAGDDDQAIFGWSGGDNGALVRLANRFETTVLKQSYRVPRRVHSVSQSIITGVKNRVRKEYLPRDEIGSLVLTLDTRDTLKSCADEALVLVRNVKHAVRYRNEYINYGRLFACEVGQSAPLEKKDIVASFHAISSWRRNSNATAPDFSRLLDLIPTYLDKRRILPHGVKAASKRNTEAVPHWRAREEFGLGPLVDSFLRESDPFAVVTKLEPEVRRYLEMVLARDPFLLGKRAIITTMHRSKGRESDCVVISPDIARRSYRRYMRNVEGRDEEIRVHYVAATRTRNQLIIEEPSGESPFFDYRSHVRAA